MERLVKKYQQKFKKVRQDMDIWNAHHSHLLKQFQTASAIIERFQVLKNKENYGILKEIKGFSEDLPAKQVESLETIFFSIQKTMDELNAVVKSLEKISQDGYYLLKGESQQPTVQQLHMRVGLRPSLSLCMDGLKAIHEMHKSEYLLTVSIISALSYDLSSADIAALRALLVDQPNIPADEVQQIFDLIFAEDTD